MFALWVLLGNVRAVVVGEAASYLINIVAVFSDVVLGFEGGGRWDRSVSESGDRGCGALGGWLMGEVGGIDDWMVGLESVAGGWRG